MSATPNPFPLEIVEKINSPQLAAFLQQFGHDKYADAEDINTIVQALRFLYENSAASDVTNEQLTAALATKENVFTKNTAFNKNFGTSSGTVTQGNDSRLIEAYNKKISAVSVTGDSNKTITLTRNDGTILTANFLDNNNPYLPDDVLNTLTFNPNNNGVLYAVTSEGAIISVSIDGRYSLLGHLHNIADINGLVNALSLKANDNEIIHNNSTQETKNGRLNVKEFTFGKSIELVAATDLDGLDTGGFYFGDGLLHSPTSGFYYVFVESLPGSSWIKQTVTSLGSGNVPNNTYIRVRVLGVWTSWKLLANIADVDDKYLNKNYLLSKFTDNANNIIEGTQTQFLAGVNQPYGTLDGSLFSLSFNSDYSTQIFGDWRTNKFYTRTRSIDSGWHDWKQLAFDVDKANLVGGNNFTGNQTMLDKLTVGKNEQGSSNATIFGTTPVRITAHNQGGAGVVNTILGFFDGKATEQGLSSFGGMKIISDSVSWFKGRLGFFTNNVDGTNPATPEVERMTISTDGFVGIGNINPTEKLDVNGNGKFIGTVQASNATQPNHLVTLQQIYTQSQSLAQFIGLAGVQTISDTKTFTSSPVIPAGTISTHAVNKAQLVAKMPDDTSWVIITTNALTAKFTNVVLRYKIKNGNYILDFTAECLGGGTNTVTNYTFVNSMPKIDSEKLKFLFLDSYSENTINSLRKFTLRSDGNAASNVSLSVDYSEYTAEVVSFRVSLPITLF